MLNKLPEHLAAEALEQRGQPVDRDAAPRDRVECDGQVVSINLLVPDPLNARLHPERNIEAIMDSLCLYGQRKPLVARQQDMVVAAGNGTLEAAKKLGWTRIAVSIRPMTDQEFYGYALADNRTAELAAWNLDVVAKVSKLAQELGSSVPGWSAAELFVLRVGQVVEAPEDFPEVDENIEVQHQCPKCGYRFSGAQVKPDKPEMNGVAKQPRTKKEQPVVIEASAGVAPDVFDDA